MKQISIDPITRLEGHGKIEIFLADDGSVANAYFQVPELRGFEKFVEGMPIEEVPRIVARICGVCPAAHHLAAGKAVDAVYHVDPPPTAKKLRELYYSAHFVHSHIAHFYALAAADFVMGPDSDPAKRNILGVAEKVGLPIAGEVLKHRRLAQDIQIMVGGKSTHPVWTVPGGVSKGITEEQRAQIVEMAKSCVEFAKFSLKLFDDVVLKNKAYLDLVLSDVYEMDTAYIGTVDAKNHVNFYHGDHRVVDQAGKEILRYKDSEYLEHIAEHVETYSYLKFPYLKKIGWKGIVDGPDSGLYQASPLSRLNAADGMATPLAQAAYEQYFSTLGGKPVKKLLATHWARLVELLYAAERLLELASDPEVASPNIRTLPTARPDRGRGHRRGAARDLDAPLQDRQERPGHRGEPHRRHHQQPRAHFLGDQASGSEAHQAGQGGRSRPAQHGRDGFPPLRPVLLVRHPHPARRDAARGGCLRRTGEARPLGG